MTQALAFRSALTFDAVGNTTALIDPVGEPEALDVDTLDWAVEEYWR